MAILIPALLLAFFAGMESAFLYSDKIRLEIDSQIPSFFNRLLKRLTLNPDFFNVTMQVGYILSLVTLGIVMAGQFRPFFEEMVESRWLAETGLVLFIALAVLVAGEFLPRTLVRISPNSLLLFFSLPLIFFYYLLSPASALVIRMVRRIQRLSQKGNVTDDEHDKVFSRNDLGNFVGTEDPEPVKEREEVDKEVILFRNALDFSKVKLRDIMVPRNEIAVLDINSDVETLRNKFVETGYSRILFYEGNKDNIVGYVHTSAIFQKARQIKPFLKNVLIVPETMAANQMLSRFIREHRSIALVVDEFGGTAGLVTTEDILEEIFGEIEDEHDTNDFTGRKINEKQFVLSGRFEIDALREKYNLDIPESDEYETLAGFILHHYESIPKVNTTLRIGDMSFKILKATLTKIELVHLTVLDN
ncbi:MAG: hemolysin family protein [Bacteroidota bacterium]|nr:hemolysin family protein [Bacteroidota bacterium]HNU76838.1 hemolysin family protein [Prolixibacteraceae bacterium]HOC86520.1 hemolysin family protein [Prolixibacteraceae bacterium]HOF54607.1 hemolysin family protein [Prolixibacteraceae bacterium]HOG96196.1 hemolysin family protein [Prolixibacteraceae bacterium]